MSKTSASRLRRWLPSVAAGVVYGSVWLVGTLLLGRPVWTAVGLGVGGAVLWAAVSLWFLGPLTRWRDRRLQRQNEKHPSNQWLTGNDEKEMTP